MNLSDIIYNKREQSVLACLNAAIEQIKDLVETNPFQTTFNIFSGCVSLEMTNEIARRFNMNKGIRAIVQQNGMMKGWSILLTCPIEHGEN